MQHLIGISTWVWESPLTDSSLPEMLDKIAAMGFDAVELPLENDGDFTPGTAQQSLAVTGLQPFLVGPWHRGVTSWLASEASVKKTQDYLSACITMASRIGSPTVCGPFYAQTGRVADDPGGAARGLRRIAPKPRAGGRPGP